MLGLRTSFNRSNLERLLYILHSKLLHFQQFRRADLRPPRAASEIMTEFFVRDATSKSIDKDVLFRTEGRGGEERLEWPNDQRRPAPCTACLEGLWVVCNFGQEEKTQ